MGKVTVYQFARYHFDTDKSTLSPSKRTAEEIERLGLKPILDTAEMVDEADLDEQGRYIRNDPLADHSSDALAAEK